jgi:CDP-glucose 4,6-dehydratase
MTKKINLLSQTFSNKKVLITGHTGFKGSWLSTWLEILGAKVLGISNNFPSNPSHYKLLNLNKKIISKNLDIRNLKTLKKFIKKNRPDFVFHLAAQSIVKVAYDSPIRTWNTNTIGTINLLESLRILKKKCVAVIITSDKCYENFETKRGYRENDQLGGKDPYSASKASADIAIRSYINSFFSSKKNKTLIATARAGNVIGGGDWSDNRLIPDCVRSWSKKKKVTIRSPHSTRPWQHVLEVIYGYIILAANLSKNSSLHGEAFNFGPSNSRNLNVISVVKLMKNHWQDVSWNLSKKKNKFLKESELLNLSSQKAKKKLKWRSVLTFQENISLVANWYKKFYLDPKNVYKITSEQINKYQEILLKRSIK